MSKYEKGMRLGYVGDIRCLAGTVITLKDYIEDWGYRWTVEEHLGTFTEPYLDSDYHIMKPKEELPHKPKEVYVKTTKTFYAVGDVLLNIKSNKADSIVKIDPDDTDFKCPIKLLNSGWIHEDMLAKEWIVLETVDRALLYNTRKTDGKNADSIVFDETVENWDIEPEPVVNVSFDLEGDDKETVTVLSYEDGSTLLNITQLNDESGENGLTVYDEVLLDLTINDMKKLKTALTSAIELSEMRK